MKQSDYNKAARNLCGFKTANAVNQARAVHSAQLQADAANEDTVLSIAANGKSSKVTHTFASVTVGGVAFSSSQVEDLLARLAKFDSLTKKSEFDKMAMKVANFPSEA